MTKTAKILLALGIVCLLVGGAINIGWIDPHGLDALYIVLPSGAVFIGLFLIVLVLQKEHEVDRNAESISHNAQSGGEPGKQSSPARQAAAGHH
jgi:hypothetical protein